MRTSAPMPWVVATFTAAITAQGYSTDFETFTASATGTPCAGQDGFYVPAVTGTIDGAIYTYAGNSLGILPNPNGGANFYAGVSAGGTAFARSQRTLTLPTGRILIEYDVACNFVGTVTPTQNIGSVSFQPSATNAHVNFLARWSSLVFPPTSWNADFVLGPSPTAGTQGPVADPAFQNLALGVWHHWGITVDLVAGVYVDFRITNGVSGITTVYIPPTPLALPGQGLGAGATDFRLFTGGTAAGNVFAVDNLRITYGAEYTQFGTGCPGALGVPSLTATSLPVLGSTLSVTIGNLPVSIAIMITGFSNTLLSGAIPLPFPLAGLGFPGCDLLVDSVSTQTLVGAGNAATWTLGIPSTATLLGAELFNQAGSLDPGPSFLAFSNGGRARLGL